MPRFLRELYHRNPPLTSLGWLLIAAFLFAFGASFFDSRTVMGINTWIKPMKFCISVTAYLWTLAWFLHYVRDSRRSFSLISYSVTVLMFIEMVCLYSQAARGVQSHFNFSISYDAAMFAMMGMMIYLNLLFDVWAFVLFLVKKPAIPNSYLLGIRLGFILFLLFAFQGQMMIARQAHSVGVPDGGPGLPMVNWSTTGGDLRIAHALGLHAFQIIPLIGWLLFKYRERLNFIGSHAAAFTVLFSIIYAGVCFGLLAQALAGRPLLSIMN
jgi:hypothetical protein